MVSFISSKYKLYTVLVNVMLHTQLYFLFVFDFPKMEAPNLIFECLGVNKVIVLVLRVLHNIM